VNNVRLHFADPPYERPDLDARIRVFLAQTHNSNAFAGKPVCVWPQVSNGANDVLETHWIKSLDQVYESVLQPTFGKPVDEVHDADRRPPH
jgi:hypothetical protein